ncbi:MAG: hypothetical protein GXO69_02070 [Acidobacteria bacterium]|nr:hypothetical protein [Acidobacteriota bacterium]
MKVEKKIQILAMGIILLVTGSLYLIFHRIEARALKSGFRPVSFGVFTVGIPRSFDPPILKEKNGWHIKTFMNRQIGTLELATASAASSDFQKAAVRYFSLKNFPVHTVFYHAGGSFRFAKNMSARVPGVLVIRTRGRGRVFTYFFNYHNTSYWLSFSTGHSLATYAGLFFKVISSLSLEGRSFHGPAFGEALQRVCREGYFVFCQPVLLFLLIPFVVGLPILLISGAVSRRMGRLPDLETLNTLLPFYTEANASVMLKLKGRSQIMSLGLVVNGRGIQLFRFGRLWIDIPGKVPGKREVRVGRGWFGGRYFQVVAPAEELIQIRSRFIRYSGMMTVRIYSDQPQMLRQYLA